MIDILRQAYCDLSDIFLVSGNPAETKFPPTSVESNRQVRFCGELEVVGKKIKAKKEVAS
jgi:hypothetical protein